MATRREMGLSARSDMNILSAGWAEVFMSGNEAEQTSKVAQDMFHCPPGLRSFLEDVIEEGIDHVNSDITRMYESGQLEAGTEEAYNQIMYRLVHLTRFVSTRMYVLGQHMVTRLPFDKLTPCPCDVLYEDELEDFLKQASYNMQGYRKSLRGDGFVILNWNPDKKPEQT